MSTTIVVLSKYKDFFDQCAKRIEQYAPGFSKLVVVDGDWKPEGDWRYVRGAQEFSCAGNGNIGWLAAGQDDVFFMADDILLVQPNTVEDMRDISYRHPEVGVLSPHILGGASPTQMNPMSDDEVVYSKHGLAFACTFFRRETLAKIGLMDWQFKRYGFDDIDWCRRAVNAGLKLGVTPKVKVKHGIRYDCSDTFNRDRRDVSAENQSNKSLYVAKWGDDKMEW